MFTNGCDSLSVYTNENPCCRNTINNVQTKKKMFAVCDHCHKAKT